MQRARRKYLLERADLIELATGDRKRAEALRALAITTAMDGAGRLARRSGQVWNLAHQGPELHQLRASIPPLYLDLLMVPGLGAARLRTLWRHFGAASLEELEDACLQDQVAQLPGFGQRAQTRTLALVSMLLDGTGRLPLGAALAAGESLAERIAEAGGVAELAGQVRRGKDLVGQLVVVAAEITPQDLEALLKQQFSLVDCRWLAPDLLRFETSGAVVGRVRLCEADALAAHVFVETGPTSHLRQLANRAKSMGKSLWKLASQCHSDREIYQALEMRYVPPELRDVEADHPLEVDLLEEGDLAGTFHIHTDWSDGASSLAGMAEMARRLGLEYLGISDHSEVADYAGGLSAGRLLEQRRAVEQLRREYPDVRLFCGCEVDILEDGSLDLPQRALESLDFVIASVHRQPQMSGEQMTARMVKAASHPLVTMLGHPTGRLLPARGRPRFDLMRVAQAAVENDTYWEINANSARLDPGVEILRELAGTGLQFVVNPDAHEPDGLLDLRLGECMARAAGIPKERVLNTRSGRETEVRLEARKLRSIASKTVASGAG